MRLLIQRVSNANVCVSNQIIGSIGKGLLVFVGIGEMDDEKTVELMTEKMLNLRIFEDENQKTNLNLNAVNGEVLLVSQFTLYADCKKGNRPSFTSAGSPQKAKELYEYMIALCRQKKIVTEQGEFGADMKVSLLNDGPFTIFLDSDIIINNTTKG